MPIQAAPSVWMYIERTASTQSPLSAITWPRAWPPGCTTRRRTGVPALTVRIGTLGSAPPTTALDSALCTFVLSRSVPSSKGVSGATPSRYQTGSVR